MTRQCTRVSGEDKKCNGAVSRYVSRRENSELSNPVILLHSDYGVDAAVGPVPDAGELVSRFRVRHYLAHPDAGEHEEEVFIQEALDHQAEASP